MNHISVGVFLLGVSLLRVSVAAVGMCAALPIAALCLSIGPQASVHSSLPAVGPARRTIAPTQNTREPSYLSHKCIWTRTGLFQWRYLSYGKTLRVNTQTPRGNAQDWDRIRTQDPIAVNKKCSPLHHSVLTYSILLHYIYHKHTKSFSVVTSWL